MAHGLPECCFEQVSVQPELITGIQNPPAGTAGTKERFRVGVQGLQTGEERLAVKVIMAQKVPQDGHHNCVTVAIAGTW